MRPIPERYQNLAIELLRDLVRIDTSNPPGNELAAAEYLQQRLNLCGITTTLLKTAPKRGNLIARLRGDGLAAPLLLVGHLDVVPAAEQDWIHPPFSAEIHDGMVWGRGTTDMKHMVAVSAAILVALAESGIKLKRDIVLAATADEEQGSTYGMAWLVKHAHELLNAECAINEGGGNCIHINNRPFVTFQVAEKGVCRTEWTARGSDGHASQPSAELATIRLARALATLGDGYIQSGVNDTMRLALLQIASFRSPEAREQVARLLEQRRIEAALMSAGLDQGAIRAVRPLFYTTAAATALQAGDIKALNVLPAKAQAWIDGRILPGQSRTDFVALLQQRCGRNVSIQPIQQQYSPGQELPAESPLFQIAEKVMAQALPGAVLVPWMCAGATDAIHLYDCGIPAYGFVPMLAIQNEQNKTGPHAANERISIANVQTALHVLYHVVRDYCGYA
ncbi:MAG: M20/M25/M40 family metallo-hydrolase [Chloroflexi bacterium]|nr:M20/M25/M40 family metallo-hydrolase [Chloroflexota bacterium]